MTAVDQPETRHEPVLVITRPRSDIGDDVREQALRAAGVVLRPFPLIRILPPAIPGPALHALARLAEFDLAVPVSPAAVQSSLAMRQGLWPATCAVGLVGPGSRVAFEQVLRARGQSPASLRIVSAPVEAADSEGLWAALQTLRTGAWAGVRVLILRGGNGRDWLTDALQAAGAVVERVDVYRRAPPDPDPATLGVLRDLLDTHAVWLLTASEGVRNLRDLLAATGTDACKLLASQRALATHSRIAEAARQTGFGRVEVCAPGNEAIVAALRGNPAA